MKMIDIPLGKALVPVDAKNSLSCKDCDINNMCMCKQELKIIGFAGTKARYSECSRTIFNCLASEREDGKQIIFKLVDRPLDSQTHD